jgi:ADP-ribose pyrophosphatase YjhB (NUDIX family)
MDSKKPGVGFGIMLLRNEKILLGKRHDDPQKASSELHGEGTWTMPGGKLHFLEKPEDGATRELFEETGMKTSPENLKLISLSNDMLSDAHFVTFGFLCEKYEYEPRVMEPDEITEWKWFELDNLPGKIYFPSKRVLDNYLAGRIYQ